MPLYDYDCANCGRRFEVIHGVYADGPAACPLCGGGPVRKAIAAPAVHFKGSGWAKKERRATSTPGTSKSTVDSSDGGDGDAGSKKSSESSGEGSGSTGTTTEKATEAGATSSSSD